MDRRSSYRTDEEAEEIEELPGPVMRPKLSRRAAMMSPADEQIVRSLREAVRTENASSDDLDDLYDEHEDGLRHPVSTDLAVRETSLAQPRGRHAMRAREREVQRQAPTRVGVLIRGVSLGRDLGAVVEMATRMYGDYDAPDLAAIRDFADRALADDAVLQSPSVRTSVQQVREGVSRAFDLVFAVVDEIAQASEAELQRTDAGLSALHDARRLLVESEYTLTWILSQYAPTEREEHERSEEGLHVFQTPEAERMRPMWRRSYGKPATYLKNASLTVEDEERAMAQAVSAATRNDTAASVGRLWLADGGYRWAVRFDETPVTFDDGSRFEPVHTVLPEA